MRTTSLSVGETVAEVVTVGGWYRTTQGRYAEVQWVDGQPQVVRLADRIPTAGQEQARIDADEAAYLAQR